MKQILLVLYFSFSVFKILPAQSTYEPLVDTNKKWSVLFNLSAEGQTSYTINVIFSSDTLIGTKLYKKVLVAEDSLQSSWHKLGYIREDTSQKRVYLMNTSFQEGLLYDFSLNKNDTVTIFNTIGCFEPVHMIADSVDTIFIAGKNRKRIFFDGFWGNIVYEGIGSMGGVVMFGRCLTGGWYDLLCFHNNDTVLFVNPVYNSCNVTIPVGLNELRKPIINIFPNPSIDNITVEMSDYQGTDIEISNIEGQSLQKVKLQSSKTFIHLQDLSGNILFVKIKNEKGVLVKKIIKLKP